MNTKSATRKSSSTKSRPVRNRVPNTAAATDIVTQSVATFVATQPIAKKTASTSKQSSKTRRDDDTIKTQSGSKSATKPTESQRDTSKKPTRSSRDNRRKSVARAPKPEREPTVATKPAPAIRKSKAQSSAHTSDVAPPATPDTSKTPSIQTRSTRTPTKTPSVKSRAGKQATVSKVPKKTRADKAQPKKTPARAKPQTQTNKGKTTGKNRAKTRAPATNKPKVQVKSRPVPQTESDGLVIGFQGIYYQPYQITAKDLFMSGAQQNHFLDILTRAKEKLLAEEAGRVTEIQESDSNNVPDPLDQGANEGVFHNQLRTRDRESQLVRKINRAIDCLKTGSYGYCEACGCEIPIRRLEARPIVTKCIDCKERDELRERQLGQ